MHRRTESTARRLVVAGLLLGLLAVSVSAAWTAAAPTPERQLLVLNYDLQGAKGPLPAAQYGELRALLMYLQPDIVALHTVAQEASGRGAALAQAALAMDMYYAYQPLTDTFGSALLSRGPIPNAVAVYDEKTQAAMGMQVDVRIGSRLYNVLVVRPPNAAVAAKTAAPVAKQLKGLAGKDYLLLASFSPRMAAKQFAAAWTKAGLFDPGARLKRPAAFTYPYRKPADRLDFALLSPKLRGDFVRVEVLAEEKMAGLSEHRPVALTLRR